MRRQLMFGIFQATAFLWVCAVFFRAVDLGWNPFTGFGLGMFGALPVSFLGIRMRSGQVQHSSSVC